MFPALLRRLEFIGLDWSSMTVEKGYPEEYAALGTHLEGTLLSVGPCDLKAKEFQLMIVVENMLHFKYTSP